MSGDAEEDLSAIAWPGFVDILSSVIIMFVFFVMIVATALFFHVLIYKAKIVAQMEQEVANRTESNTQLLSQAIKVLEKQIQAVTEEKEVLEHVVAKYEQEFYQARAEFTESENQTMVYDEEKQEMIVFFGRSAISVTEEIKTQITDALNSYIAKYGAGNVEITLEGSVSPGFDIQTTARQIAVARMFNVRNVFLDLEEFPPKNLKPRLIDGTEIESSFHWVRVKFKETQ